MVRGTTGVDGGRRLTVDEQVTDHHLILYDGVCPLCNALVRFVLPRDRGRVFVYASLQSATGRSVLERHGRDPEDLHTFYLAQNHGSAHETLLSKSGAVLFVARHLRAPWNWVRVARVLPAALRDWLYDLVARHRYRAFGRYETCPVPPERYADRFIDV